MVASTERRLTELKLLYRYEKLYSKYNNLSRSVSYYLFSFYSFRACRTGKSTDSESLVELMTFIAWIAAPSKPWSTRCSTDWRTPLLEVIFSETHPYKTWASINLSALMEQAVSQKNGRKAFLTFLKDKNLGWRWQLFAGASISVERSEDLQLHHQSRGLNTSL